MGSTFPDMCKVAKVIPVHKGGEPVNDNYRPISMLSVFSKSLEKIVDMQLKKQLETNKIFSAKQCRFRQKHSLETTLGELLGDLVEIFDKKHKSIAVFIDQRKAFDSGECNILLSRLGLYGVKGQILMWFSSHLQNRKQFVTTDEHNSVIHQVEYGVSQGGILSTLLFLIMINY